MRLNIPVGQTFGRLTVEDVARSKHTPGGQIKTQVKCLCSCGKTKVIALDSIKRGLTQSCGCLMRERQIANGKKNGIQKTHGESRPKTPEWMVWTSIIQRCFNPKNRMFRHYGARGITICPEWRHNYLAFRDHIGRRPSPDHSIDRFPNKDGNYEPGNVRWATAEEQQNNKRTNVLITIDGDTRSVAQWTRYFKRSRNWVRRRYAS